MENENITAPQTEKHTKFSLARKQSFSQSIKDASPFIKAVRWIYMVLAVIETVIAFAFWIVMLVPTEVVNLTSYFFMGMNILPYIIPAITLALIILFIVLCIDAAETKTEIKIRAVFILLTIMPVLMTWKVVVFKWIQYFKG